jgi:hypothetical protein
LPKIKALLRKAEACKREMLFEALGDAVSAVASPRTSEASSSTVATYEWATAITESLNRLLFRLVNDIWASPRCILA